MQRKYISIKQFLIANIMLYTTVDLRMKLSRMNYSMITL